jgi:formamidopyrimidine-DNA glycosylase
MLKLWVDRLRTEGRAVFPEKVTAFRDDMAAHGRYGKPCPVCGEKIQRIRYADNETNYCADWPRTLAELEVLKRR